MRHRKEEPHTKMWGTTLTWQVGNNEVHVPACKLLRRHRPKKLRDFLPTLWASPRPKCVEQHVYSTRNHKLLGTPGIATRSKKLLGAPGIATRSKKLLGAPGIATRSKKLLEAPGIAARSKKLVGTPGIATRSKKLLGAPGIATGARSY